MKKGAYFTVKPVNKPKTLAFFFTVKPFSFLSFCFTSLIFEAVLLCNKIEAVRHLRKGRIIQTRQLITISQIEANITMAIRIMPK